MLQKLTSDYDFTDSGGNTASKNSKCNGFFVGRGQKCIPFEFALGTPPNESNNPSLTNSPSQRTFQNPSGGEITCRRNGKRDASSCITIEHFADFKKRVEKASGTLVFCPFEVEKEPHDEMIIRTKIELICKRPRKCHIKGPRSQIKIEGPSAQVFFQGFVFEGATISAVRVSSSALKPQSFCDCHFLK